MAKIQFFLQAIWSLPHRFQTDIFILTTGRPEYRLFLDAHYRNREADTLKDPYSFTIHNLKYQAFFQRVFWEIFGSDWNFHIDGVEFYDSINFLRQVFLFFELFCRTYAEEIKYDFFGENLQIS